jgi:hypothetical protein
MVFAIPQEPNDLRLGWVFKSDVQRHVGGRVYPEYGPIVAQLSTS